MNGELAKTRSIKIPLWLVKILLLMRKGIYWLQLLLLREGDGDEVREQFPGAS
jgi:hypothetical protein